MNAQTNNKGFTIIEVVLVLAIAALIFLMIFIALPALQRGQRDTARKNDANSVASAIGTYRSNSRGDISGLTSGDVDDNISQVTVDGTVTALTSGKKDQKPSDLDTAKIYTNAKCDSNGRMAVYSSSARSAAVVVLLEAGSNLSACTDS